MKHTLWFVLCWWLSATPVAYCRSSSSDKKIPKSEARLSRRFNRGVQDVYQKAELLQDRAYKRINELQERAQEIQNQALKRAETLERQAERLLDRATQQAQDLQREAALQLGELKETIESLPIAENPTVQATAVDETPPPPPPVEGAADTTSHALQERAVSGSLYPPPPPLEEIIEEISVEVDAVPKSKWANVRERTLPAVLMLGALALYTRVLGGNMIPLIHLIQVGLYAETCGVAGVVGVTKWWWFIAAVIACNGRFLEWKNSDAISYGMASTGIVSWVIRQNVLGTVEAFRTSLRSLAATSLALLILVGQSSFWIATLQEYGLMWILYPAFLVIVNDTMAYVFGMLFGKHALLPVISPKKTWEGFVGATVSTLAISQPLLQYMMTSSSESSMDDLWQHALSIGTFVSLVSPFGGFLASVVKRAHGKKDFATWIPGHGGVVDRLDCQVMTAPFVYFYLTHCLNAAAEATSAM